MVHNVCVYDGLGIGGFVNDFKNDKADQSRRPPFTKLNKETESSEYTNYPSWHKHLVVGCQPDHSPLIVRINCYVILNYFVQREITVIWSVCLDEIVKFLLAEKWAR